jgi:hypothetical protein
MQGWYYAAGTQSVGPMSLQDLEAALRRFPNWKEVPVWREGLSEWKKAGDVSDLFNNAGRSVTPTHTVQPTYAQAVEGELRVGHIFGGAWNIFSANLVLFLAIGLVVALPNLILVMLSPAETNPFATFGNSPPPSAFGWHAVIGWIVATFLNLVSQAVILYIAFQYLRGQPVALGDAVNKGLARILPILGLVILFGLGIWVGLLLLIIPGIMLMVRWSVAVPACVLEGTGPAASLGRSAALTKGHRWKIFGIFLLIWIGSIVFGALIGLIAYQLGLIANALSGFVWTALWTGYFNSVVVMVYHDLRVAKEGIDVNQIAAVFD